MVLVVNLVYNIQPMVVKHGLTILLPMGFLILVIALDIIVILDYGWLVVILLPWVIHTILSHGIPFLDLLVILKDFITIILYGWASVGIHQIH